MVGVQASDSVSVTASISDSISMRKFTEPLIETPQSVTVVPQFVMQDQGLSTLRDTLRNVPGISLAAGEAGAQGDNLTIRGFTARNDIFLDGITGLWQLLPRLFQLTNRWKLSKVRPESSSGADPRAASSTR